MLVFPTVRTRADKNRLDLTPKIRATCSFPRQKSLIITLQPGMRNRDYQEIPAHAGPRSEQYMIKKLSIFAFLALILLPAGGMAAGVQGSSSISGSPDDRAITPFVSSVQTVALTDDETDWLTYMREEEKVARDVYLYLNETWNVRTFKNIAASEQTHMDAIKVLLDRYTIPDPAAGKGRGEFTNPDLQKLYDNLVRQGSSSKVEALQVGVIIEETDIDDLTEGIATTRHNDIRTVYSNLLQGSLNHLDAFESGLAKL
jgi:hypothetical protein